MDYYATLGYTPIVVADVQTFASQDPRVVIFRGDLTSEQKDSLAAVRTMARSLALDVRDVEMPKPWNFASCLSIITQTHHELGRPKDLVVNASGGTEVMNSAMTLFASLVGARTRYVDRWSSEVVEIDFELLRNALSLEGTRRDLMQRILAEGGVIKTKGLAQALGVSNSALSQHLQRLAKDKLIRDDGGGRTTTVEASPALWSLTALLSHPAPAKRTRPRGRRSLATSA